MVAMLYISDVSPYGNAGSGALEDDLPYLNTHLQLINVAWHLSWPEPEDSNTQGCTRDLQLEPGLRVQHPLPGGHAIGEAGAPLKS